MESGKKKEHRSAQSMRPFGCFGRVRDVFRPSQTIGVNDVICVHVTTLPGKKDEIPETPDKMRLSCLFVCLS